MNAHWGVLLDWTVADFAVLGIAIQQYISISRDIKRSKAKEAAEQNEAEKASAPKEEVDARERA